MLGEGGAASSYFFISLRQDTHWTIGNFVEVVARVQPDLTLKALMSIDLGTEVGMWSFLFFSSFLFPWFLLADLSFVSPPPHYHVEFLDMNAVEAVVDVNHQYKEIFYDS